MFYIWPQKAISDIGDLQITVRISIIGQFMDLSIDQTTNPGDMDSHLGLTLGCQIGYMNG